MKLRLKLNQDIILNPNDQKLQNNSEAKKKR